MYSVETTPHRLESSHYSQTSPLISMMGTAMDACSSIFDLTAYTTGLLPPQYIFTTNIYRTLISECLHTGPIFCQLQVSVILSKCSGPDRSVAARVAAAVQTAGDWTSIRQPTTSISPGLTAHSLFLPSPPRDRHDRSHGEDRGSARQPPPQTRGQETKT